MIRAILVFAAILSCSGCATNTFVANDLEQAAKTAEAYGKKEAAQCWRDLAAYNAVPVVGAFSAYEKAKDVPLLEACFRK